MRGNSCHIFLKYLYFYYCFRCYLWYIFIIFALQQNTSFSKQKKSLPFGETLAEEHSGTLLLAEDEDVTGQLVRDATIFANKEVVIMLLQSIAAFLRIPAGSDANTVRIALNDEENVASLHLHYGCGFAVLTTAVNSLANCFV